jgi:3-hydroxyisobutyrate dehydrogenase
VKVGYVGLGNMGGALAARLQLTHPLSVYDLNQAAVRRLVGKGATPCSTLLELASRCEVVMLCLPTSDHVREAIFGDKGLLPGLAKGAVVVDQSSGDPAATRAMANELAVRGIDLVDAPVSGGPDGAEAGTIAIMVGATPEQYARVLPVLSAISPNVFHAGGSGAGHVIKLVNNMLSGAQRVLSLEAITLAAKHGIDPKKACEILAAGGARNAYLESYFRQRLLTGKARLGFSLGLMHKDLRLACQLGSASQVPLFLANAAKEYYQLCISQLGEGSNVQSVALVADRLAGTQVVPSNHDLQ